jgi:hypothetical protein
MKTKLAIILFGLCSLCVALASAPAKATPQNSKGHFDVYGCPAQVQCNLDGGWMNPEDTYNNGGHISKKYGHDYYDGGKRVHHYVIIHCPK